MNRSRPTGVSMRSHYKEAKAFVERQLSMSLGDSEEAVIAALQDGTVLCRLCASLLPDLAMGKPKTPSKKVHFRGAAFENWDQFGKLCRKLQVDESFIISMSALADSGSGNTRPVWRCIVEIKSVSGVGAPRPAPTPAKEATLGDAVGFADEASAAAPPAAEAAVAAPLNQSLLTRIGATARKMFSPVPAARGGGGARTPGQGMRNVSTPGTGFRSGLQLIVDDDAAQQNNANVRLAQCINSVQKRKHDDRVGTLVAQLTAAKQENAELSTENKELTRERVATQATIESALEQHTAERAVAKAQLATLKEERAVAEASMHYALENALKDATARGAELEKARTTHDAALRAAQEAQRTAASEARCDIDAARSAAKAEATRLAAERDEARAEAARLEEAIATAAAEAAHRFAEREATARAEIDAVRAAQADNDTERAARLASLEDDVGTLRAEASALREERAALTATALELTTAASAASAAHETGLASAVAAAQEAAAARAASAEEARAAARAAAHAAEVLVLKGAIATRENDREAREAERDAARADAAQARAAAVAAATQHAATLAELNARVAALESEVAASIAPRQLAGVTSELSAEYTTLKSSVVRLASAHAVELKTLAVTVRSNMQLLQDQRDDARTTLAEEASRRREAHNKLQRMRGNIRVFCRVRPILPHELAAGETVAVQCKGSSELSLTTTRRSAMASSNKEKTSTFNFDEVFPADATQARVWSEVKPLVVSVLDGFHACIFAYGQTGSGKTFTMGGTEASPGLNRHALSELFTEAARQQKAGLRTLAIKVSMVEIYNEHVRDLLCAYADGAEGAAMEEEEEESEPAVPRNLVVRQGPHGAFVDGAQEIDVATLAEVEAIMQAGNAQRSVSATSCNSESSRSHSLLMVNVESSLGSEASGAAASASGSTTLRAGRLVLVDLAGSERLKKSEVEGAQLKEAQHINKSLSAFGDVVQSLSKKASHIPYRNSTLTFLLQDSLGSDNKCVPAARDVRTIAVALLLVYSLFLIYSFVPLCYSFVVRRAASLLRSV